ncbi:hypothetical protein [Acetobacter syzygii]|uniref:hypothetical protein n=1 Tax=Acetobacter syzygii TaxID=146476 RepID=UPI00156F6FCF|nr:hypothetical protein [Acetobacter syzygii]NSL92938.1 hypothetical protein [Acetobacter syzygii]
MTSNKNILLIPALFMLSSCASIIEGTNQQIKVNTNPSGAECAIYRNNERIATIENTPGSALIKKTKRDIWIACIKDGYDYGTFQNHSGMAGASFGNIVAGGLIGVAIDSASGADNKYDGTVNITLPLAPSGSPKKELPQVFDGSFNK